MNRHPLSEELTQFGLPIEPQAIDERCTRPAAVDAKTSRWATFVARHPGRVVLACLLGLGLLMSALPQLRFDASTESFLAEDDPTRVEFDAFRDVFGRSEPTVLAIPIPERVGDPVFLDRIERLHTDLEARVPNLRRITSLANVRHIEADEDSIRVGELLEALPSTEEERARFETRLATSPLYSQFVVSEDGLYTLVFFESELHTTDPLPGASPTDAVRSENDFLDTAGFGDLDGDTSGMLRRITPEEDEAMLTVVREIVAEHARPDFEIRLAGGIMVERIISRALRLDFVRLLLIAMVVIGGLLVLLFRSVAAAFLVMGVVLLSLFGTIGSMAWAGAPVTLGTQVLPTLLLAIGVGYSVHVVTLFRTKRARGAEPRDAIHDALTHATRPIGLTAVTTVAGLVSFAPTELMLARHIGYFAPIGVLLAAAASLSLLPALLILVPLRFGDDARLEGARALLSDLGQRALDHRGHVLVAATLATAFALAGVAQLRMGHDPRTWFRDEPELDLTIDTISEHFGGTAMLELLIEPEQGLDLRDPRILARMEAIERHVLALEVGPQRAAKALGLHSIVKEVNQALADGDPASYRVPQDPDLVAQEIMLFENGGADDLAEMVDSTFTTGRLSIRTLWLDAEHSTRFANEVVAEARRQLDGLATVKLGGLDSLTKRAFQALNEAMITSYAVAFLVVTALIVAMIGNLRIGLIAMVPNLLPILCAMGFMGWMGIPISTFTLLVGSVILGLAVDDTIHVAHGFARHLERSGDPREAIDRTLSTTGVALLFSSVALVFGFSSYALGSLWPMLHFGLVAAFGIIAALVADLVLLPVLLVAAFETKPRAALAPSRALLGALVLGVVLLAAPGAIAKTFDVNSTEDAGDVDPGDGRCSTGKIIVLPIGGFVFECTLRAAIEEANALPGRDRLEFDSPLLYDPSTFGAVWEPSVVYQPITDPIDIDGTTAPGYDPEKMPFLRLFGRGALTGFWFGQGSRDSTVKGFSFQNFDAGIYVRFGDGVWIDQCAFGYYQPPVTPWVPSRWPNEAGVHIDPGATNTWVGAKIVAGEFVGYGNVISGNDHGVFDVGVDTTVIGNRIGTDFEGETSNVDALSGDATDGSLGNDFGITVVGGDGTRIGARIGSPLDPSSPVLARGNVISGNDEGIIVIKQLGDDPTTIVANLVGTNADGDRALGNDRYGIRTIVHFGTVSIGTLGAGNVVSGNLGDGLYLGGSSPSDASIRVVANRIGTGSDGDLDLGNDGWGIRLDGHAAHTITLNVVGHNALGGVLVEAPSPSTASIGEATIGGNRIGVSSLGQRIGNDGPGIRLDGAGAVVVDNHVGDNTVGILLGEESSDARIETNYVGTDAAGLDLGNAGPGIESTSVLGLHRVGGVGTGNIVGWNGDGGLLVTNAEESIELVGNYVGVDPSGSPVPNARRGIGIRLGASDDAPVVIGARIDVTADSKVATRANRIGHNHGDGIELLNEAKSTIRGNHFADNARIEIDLGADGDTPNDVGDLDFGANRLINHPVVDGPAGHLDSHAGRAEVHFSIGSHPLSVRYPIVVDFYLVEHEGHRRVHHVASERVELAESGAMLERVIDLGEPIPYAALVATATDDAGNTSELSKPVLVPEPRFFGGLTAGMLGLFCMSRGGRRSNRGGPRPDSHPKPSTPAR